MWFGVLRSSSVEDFQKYDFDCARLEIGDSGIEVYVQSPGREREKHKLLLFSIFLLEKNSMSLSVCLYFDVFGQAIFTVNQVSPVTSSVGPARHTLHTLVFERNSFEFHRLT